MPSEIEVLESVFGIDLFFDARFGVKGSKDVASNPEDTDYQYTAGPLALAEELQRLFDLTPLGSCIDDLSYGINLDFIGQPLDPKVACALARVEALRALTHPSFKSRFRVRRLETDWTPDTPNAILIGGILELYGFRNVPYVRFGPYALNYLYQHQERRFG
jgi:hypothetical protein